MRKSKILKQLSMINTSILRIDETLNTCNVFDEYFLKYLKKDAENLKIKLKNKIDHVYLVNEKFFLEHKPILNEKVFWRDHPQGIQIKLIPAMKKYIPTQVLNLITKNPL